MAMSIDDILKALGSKPGDLSGLTDDELKAQLSAYQDIPSQDPYNQQLVSTFQKINPGALKNEQYLNKPGLRGEILGRLKGQLGPQYGNLIPKEDTYEQLADYLTENLSNVDNKAAYEKLIDLVKPQNVGRSSANRTGMNPLLSGRGDIQDILGTTISDYKRNLLSFMANRSKVEGDFSGQIKSINDLLAARGKKASGDKALDNLIQTLPGQLQSNEKKFIQGLQGQGSKTLEQQLIPEILAGANNRGLLRSGDLEDQLVNAGAGVQNEIQNQYLDIQSQDDEFFQNIAYNTTLRQSLEAGGDVQGQVQYQQKQAEGNQKNAFSSAQKSLNQNLQMKLFQKQQERLLMQQQREYQRQQDMRNKQSQDALIGGIGSAVGSVAGGYVGSRAAKLGLATTK